MSLAPGQFHCPSGIVVLPDGDILVADINRGDVQRFNADGTFDRSLCSFATPSGINFDADGNLVIVDSKVARVNVVTPDGVVRLSFGTQGSAPGQLWQPDDAVRSGDANHIEPCFWRPQRAAEPLAWAGVWYNVRRTFRTLAPAIGRR